MIPVRLKNLEDDWSFVTSSLEASEELTEHVHMNTPKDTSSLDADNVSSEQQQKAEAEKDQEVESVDDKLAATSYTTSSEPVPEAKSSFLGNPFLLM